jgi:cellulose synthase/poly-beta-1,6-N-acetylglucosamine synthase-like glycosyltransferase
MHLHLVAAAIFSLSLAVLAYTFFGYGLLVSWLARRAPARSLPPAGDSPRPPVCVVLAARNEEKNIAERLENLFASDYPAGSFRVLLVSDGSTDETVARAEAMRAGRRLDIIVRPERAGKAACLNEAVARCEEEIIVFTDARQRFAADAIARLADHFRDPAIGAVSGELEIAPAGSVTGAGVDAYWRYEKQLRAAESRLDSCIGCTGAIYAIRRAQFAPIPEDTLLDDVVIPMQIAVAGQRVIHDSTAHAFDPQPLEPASEARRKQRTLAGGFQMLFRYPLWLRPSRNRVWWQLISHKYLRLVAPVFLFSALASNAVLVWCPFFAACFVGQLVLYACAVVGMAGGKGRMFAIPAGFVFLNLMTLRGLRLYLTGSARKGWA